MQNQKDNSEKNKAVVEEKRQQQSKNDTKEMLSDSDYKKGAHDPVGEDARRSREKAEQYQNKLKQ